MESERISYILETQKNNENAVSGEIIYASQLFILFANNFKT